ncbi:MAG: single-stranded-DNA-specific exonuclease RecJ [Lachnospiraceae bacterium]|nr:single-stranded-DNA-specific exonuclease RecJ [Lachnospiraceae bacterium]
MEKWVVAAKRADFYGIAKKFGIDPVLARIIRNRDVVGDPAIDLYLHGGMDDLPSPWLLKDMEKAVEILLEGIRLKKRVRIIGDYDIDGVCASAILYKGFRRIGLCADTYIPHRVTDGYGLNAHLIGQAGEDGIELLVTCDNGIAAHQEVAQAKAMGMTVIVTDHHNIPYEEKEGRRIPVLPPADAVIDPKQEDCPYPFSELCGAAIAYKLISALYERCGLPKEELEESLILAAVATVGDVMDLQGENRILVKEGLRRLPHTKSPGLQALLEVNDLTGEVSAYHIGFVLGPCINASGRLDTAQRSLQLLLETDPQRAAVLAGDLLHMNESRKSMTAVQVEEAVRLVEAGTYGDDKILVIYLPKCHESLAGIVAGRVRERCHRPVFILTDGEQDVKGSGRSIEAYPMYDGLNACSDLLVRFGGHAMAAGLSIHREDVDELRRRLNGQCTLTEQDMIPKTVIDVPMPISYVTEELIRQMSLLEPFGKGNAKPLFAERDIRVRDYRILGKNKNVVRMDLETSDGCCRPGICFTDVEKVTGILAAGRPVSILYYPQIHEYRGSRDIQIVIQGIQAVSD